MMVVEVGQKVVPDLWMMEAKDLLNVVGAEPVLMEL